MSFHALAVLVLAVSLKRDVLCLPSQDLALEVPHAPPTCTLEYLDQARNSPSIYTKSNLTLVHLVATSS